MSETTPSSLQRTNHVQTPYGERPNEWNSLQGRRWFVGHIGVELTSFAFFNNLFSHFIYSRPIKSSPVCFGHDGSGGRVVTTSSRVDLIQDQSTFLWGDAT